MTHPKLKKLPQLLLVALSAGTTATFLVSPAFAQQATPQKIEKIEVTGSNIKRIDAETSAPIQVITADEIRRSGRQTVTELLRELPINAAGGLTELSGSGSFSAGAASASLRGLGTSATLVLLNGRRIAPYGLPDPNFGQSGGAANLNSFPIDAIERIEILKTGASAIYGSEAIAGVINIILKKDYKGAQVGVQGSTNKDAKYTNETVTGTFGFGDLAKDKYNVFGNVEIFHQDHVLYKDVFKFLQRNEYRNNFLSGVQTSAYSPYLTYLNRNAANTAFTSAAAGPNCPPSQIVNSALPQYIGLPGTQCLYDNVSRTEIVPKIDRASFFARGSYDLTGTTQLFAEASFVKSKTFFLGYPVAVGQGQGGTFNSITGGLNLPPQFFPSGNVNNPNAPATGLVSYFRGRFDAVGPQNNEIISKTTRVLGGIKSTIGSFDVESGLLYNLSEQDQTNYNSIRFSQLVAGINATGAGQGYNFANPTAGSVTPDTLRISPKDNSKSSFTILDFKASGEIGSLPGGAVGVAAGAEFRHEERKVSPDPAKLIGEVFGRGIASADGTRNVSTVFAELNLPVVKNVEVQLAGRYDRYSDYGNSVTPKVAASWAATPALKFRGSFERGFRAPSLTEVSKSSTAGFFQTNDPRRCFPTSNPATSVTVGCNFVFPGLIVANPLVKPEKAESWSGGFIFEPTAESSISIDYFAIARRNEIAFQSVVDLLNNEGSTDPRYANKIFRDPTNTDPKVPNDPGAIQYVKLGFENLGETRVKGMDIDARYRMSISDLGRLTFNLSATTFFEQKSSGAAGAILNSYSGYRNAPKWRAQFRTNWEIGNWTNTGTVNFLEGFTPWGNPALQSPATRAQIADCGNPNNPLYLGVCRVADYVTVDVGTEYRGFKNLRLSFLVRNLMNEKPSKDPRAVPFNTTWYQPQGINFVLGAKYTFN